MKIIDAHAHLAFSPSTDAPSTGDRSRASAKGLVRVLDQWGISMASVSHEAALWLHNWDSEGRTANADVAAAAREYPRRILGAYAPNPFLESAKAVYEDVASQVERYGFRSIKLHPILGGYPANATELAPIYQAAQECRIPILYHSGHIPYCTPAEMFDMAKRFPKVNIIAGHAGKTELCHDMLAVARYVPNLYIDTCSQPIRAFLERFVDEIGSERVLFASDWEAMDAKGVYPMRVLEIEELEISEAEKRNIFYENAARLFRVTEGE